jgi:hypothetical protein
MTACLLGDGAIGEVPMNPAVDTAHAGPGVLYFSRLIARAIASRLNKIGASPIYPSLTIRNWNTTTKLLSFDGVGDPVRYALPV